MCVCLWRQDISRRLISQESFTDMDTHLFSAFSWEFWGSVLSVLGQIGNVSSLFLNWGVCTRLFPHYLLTVKDNNSLEVEGGLLIWPPNLIKELGSLYTLEKFSLLYLSSIFKWGECIIRGQSLHNKPFPSIALSSKDAILGTRDLSNGVRMLAVKARQPKFKPPEFL